jgi:hypothetical protein
MSEAVQETIYLFLHKIPEIIWLNGVTETTFNMHPKSTEKKTQNIKWHYVVRRIEAT